MSQVDELINSLSPDEIAAYTARPQLEEHIVVGEDRFVYVPESLRRIAVQFDHNIETVTFDCVRFWDDIDMSEMGIYINYLRSDGVKGSYLADNVRPDEEDSSIMHFDWTISNNVTKAAGNITFLICVKKIDDAGLEQNHWNSELNTEMIVSKGLECSEDISMSNPDIIAKLLAEDEVFKLHIEEWLLNKITIYDAINNLNNKVNNMIPGSGGNTGSSTIVARAGYVGSVTLNASDWYKNTIVKTFAEFADSDGIMFTPSTRSDRDVASNADIFVSADKGRVTFTVATTPTSNIKLDYMIVKGTTAGGNVTPDNPDNPSEPDTPVLPKLASPVISILSNKFLTVEHENLTSYDILVDGVVKANAMAPEYRLSNLGLSYGEHTITVVAKRDGYSDSDPSNAVSYIEMQILTLDLTSNDINAFSLDYRRANVADPIVYISDDTVLSSYVDSDAVYFTTLAAGPCVAEIRKDLGNGMYVVVSRATVNVYDFIVNVGDTLTLPVDPEADQTDYELIVNPSDSIEVRRDNGTWHVTALKSGTYTVGIDDGDETIHHWVVKVNGNVIKLATPVISILSNKFLTVEHENLTSYDILVDGVVKTNAMTPEYNLSNLELSYGEYIITVVAKRDGYSDSNPSNEVSYIEMQNLTLDLTSNDINAFSLDYRRANVVDPIVYISDDTVLSSYVDSDAVYFTTLSSGSCIAELRKDLGDNKYIVIARATVEVYDFVVTSGDTFALPVDPEADQTDYELIVNPSDIVEVRNDNGTWNVTALKSGICTIGIDDGDETIYHWEVKVR